MPETGSGELLDILGGAPFQASLHRRQMHWNRPSSLITRRLSSFEVDQPGQHPAGRTPSSSITPNPSCPTTHESPRSAAASGTTPRPRPLPARATLVQPEIKLLLAGVQLLGTDLDQRGQFGLAVSRAEMLQDLLLAVLLLHDLHRHRTRSGPPPSAETGSQARSYRPISAPNTPPNSPDKAQRHRNPTNQAERSNNPGLSSRHAEDLCTVACHRLDHTANAEPQMRQ